MVMTMKIKDIPPPLSARTLAHARHVMTVAGVIMVLAWVPGWNLATLNPFGFMIDAMTVLSIWCVLSGVLAYFTIRLFIGVQGQLPPWLKHFDGLIKKFKDGDRTPVPDAVGRMALRAVWTGKFLPLLVAAFGLVVALSEILPLVTGSPQ